jgi:hypothetical protein
MSAPGYSESYPYLDIARKHGLDYGEVLDWSDALTKEKINSDRRMEPLPREADRDICAIGLREYHRWGRWL